MTAVAKQGNPTVVSRLPSGVDRVGSGFIAGANIGAGDACTLEPNTTALSASVPIMQVIPADGSADGPQAIVVGFAAQEGLSAQGDAITLMAESDWRYGVGFVAAFLNGANGPVFVYLSATVPGGLDTAPPWEGAAPVGMIIDDSRIRLWGSRGYADLGSTPSLELGQRYDEFTIAATVGNGGAFAWQNTNATPIIIPVGGVIADVQTVASATCTLSIGSAASGTTAGTNLLNAQDVHSATGLFSNSATVKVAAGSWVTGTLSAPTDFVGNLVLNYIVVAN